MSWEDDYTPIERDRKLADHILFLVWNTPGKDLETVIAREIGIAIARAIEEWTVPPDEPDEEDEALRREPITAWRLRELLHYDPETGIFRWRTKKSPRVETGDEAGANENGYRAIKIDSRSYKAHRLAWLYIHGEWPEGSLDHIDRNKSNNRIANLRLATLSQNQANVVRRTSKFGFPGVKRNGRRWAAQININGKKTHLGTFDTIEEAAAVYEAKAAAVRGEFRPPSSCEAEIAS